MEVSLVLCKSSLDLAEIRINGKPSQVTKRVFNVLYPKKLSFQETQNT
jgi:hypothetical protein